MTYAIIASALWFAVLGTVFVVLVEVMR